MGWALSRRSLEEALKKSGKALSTSHAAERSIETQHNPTAPWAMNVQNSRGRRYAEPAHPYRSDYVRDRDRIVHARAFRRLEAKTQVFTMRFSDHFRNRLTHTIEVAQIARTVADAVGLNAALVEALALVHDIGHPPFGHAGEHKLDELMRAHGSSFNHNLHALRIVEHFEQRYLDFPGLNLTFEVREGIVKHSRDYRPQDFPELSEYLLDLRPTLEAQLIDCVDEIAYDTADLDDALEAGLLDITALCQDVSFFGAAYNRVEKLHPSARDKLKFNEALKQILNFLVTDLIESTQQHVRDAGVAVTEDIRRAPQRLADFSAEGLKVSGELKRFLFAQVYSHPAITEDRDRSVRCLEELFRHYSSKSGSMPAAYEEAAAQSPRAIVVCDYIAGMTDQFLLRQHQEQFGLGDL